VLLLRNLLFDLQNLFQRMMIKQILYSPKNNENNEKLMINKKLLCHMLDVFILARNKEYFQI